MVGNTEILYGEILAVLNQNRGPDENILFWLKGTSKSEAMIILPRRVVIIKRKAGGLTKTIMATSFALEEIIAVNIHSGFLSYTIEVSTNSTEAAKSGEKSVWITKTPQLLSNCILIAKSRLEKFQPNLEKLRGMISEAKKRKSDPQGKGAENIASQLVQLTNLYKSGALAEDEFQIAKNRVLGISNNQSDQEDLTTRQQKTNVMTENIDMDNRTLCSDESCIGIIGPDGQCTECGKNLSSE